eukprot:3071852-Pyramimonas_sp.AAC.1
MLCPPPLRSVTLRHAPLRSVTLRHPPLHSVTLRHAPLRSGTLRGVRPVFQSVTSLQQQASSHEGCGSMGTVPTPFRSIGLEPAPRGCHTPVPFAQGPGVPPRTSRT